MMCKTNLHDSNYCDNVLDNPVAGTGGQHRRALTAHGPGHATGPRVTDPSHLLSSQATCLSGVNSKRVTRHTIGRITHRKASVKLQRLGPVFFFPGDSAPGLGFL